MQVKETGLGVVYGYVSEVRDSCLCDRGVKENEATPDGTGQAAASSSSF